MSCFIDGLKECDMTYKKMLLSFMPEIKEHKFCKKCLESKENLIKISDCPYFKLCAEQSPHLFLP
jgi:hypothetical protein